MEGPTRRTGSRRRLSTNNARLTLHHPSLRHNHRTTEGNAQDSQGFRVLSGEVCLLPGSLERSPHLTRKDGFGDGFWDGFFEPYFSCAKRGRIFSAENSTVSERRRRSSDSLADKKWETLDVLSIAICERLWSPCPELDWRTDEARKDPRQSLAHTNPFEGL